MNLQDVVLCGLYVLNIQTIKTLLNKKVLRENTLNNKIIRGSNRTERTDMDEKKMFISIGLLCARHYSDTLQERQEGEVVRVGIWDAACLSLHPGTWSLGRVL